MRFIQDEDGHWYLINKGLELEFENWLSKMSKGEWDWDGVDFDKMRCNHPSTYLVQILD